MYIWYRFKKSRYEKFVSVLFGLLCWLNIIAQEVLVSFYFEDAVGRKDTVVVGLDNNATHNIDTVFNEIDIFGTPLDSFDVRVVQRDTLANSCVYNYFWNNINGIQFYPTNRDLKVDIRSINFLGGPVVNFGSIQNNFEIRVHAFDYPVTVTAEVVEQILGLFENWTFLDVVDTNCVATNQFFLYDFRNIPLILTSSMDTTIIFQFGIHVGIEEFGKTAPKWKILPNPSNDIITLSGFEVFDGKIEIVNLLGEIVETKTVSAVTFPIININQLKNGIYFIRYFSEQDKQLSINKFIKN